MDPPSSAFRLMGILWLAWPVAMIAAIGLTAVASPGIASDLQRVCSRLPCENHQTMAPLAEWLDAHGISLQVWATIVLASVWFRLLGMCVAAAWLLWRGRWRWITLVLAWMALATGVAGVAGVELPSALVVRIGGVGFMIISTVTTALGLALFPTDRLWRPWVRPVLLAALALGLLGDFFADLVPGLSEGAGVLAAIALLVLLLTVMMRWRGADDPAERRVVGLALAGALVTMIGPLVLLAVSARTAPPLSAAVLTFMPMFFAVQVVWLMVLVMRMPAPAPVDMTVPRRSARPVRRRKR